MSNYNVLFLDSERIVIPKKRSGFFGFNFGRNNKEVETSMYKIRGSTAQIKIDGILTRGKDMFSFFNQTTSSDDIIYYLIEAVENKEVTDIELLINSAGGEIDGIEKTGRLIKACKKPITAIVDGLCCSAAYWLASQCDKILATAETNIIGSVGVMSVFYDDKLYGIKKVNSRYNLDKNTENTEKIQNHLDKLAEVFLEAVSVGRGWGIDEPQEIAKKCGNGLVYVSAEAINLNLIDGYYYTIEKENNMMKENKEETSASLSTEKTEEADFNFEEAKEILRLSGVKAEVIDFAFSGKSSGDFAKQKLIEIQAKKTAEDIAEAKKMEEIKKNDADVNKQIENVQTQVQSSIDNLQLNTDEADAEAVEEIKLKLGIA